MPTCCSRPAAKQEALSWFIRSANADADEETDALDRVAELSDEDPMTSTSVDATCRLADEACWRTRTWNSLRVVGEDRRPPETTDGGVESATAAEPHRQSAGMPTTPPLDD